MGDTIEAGKDEVEVVLNSSYVAICNGTEGCSSH